MNLESSDISARLKDIRLYFGYKQTEVADVLGVCRNTYCEYEHHKRIIPLIRLNYLANFYEIKIDCILGLSNTIQYSKPKVFDSDIISKKILEIRQDNNLTIREFAKKLGISNSLISDYENGKKLISTSICYNIAKKYNISVDYLLGRSSTKYLKK